jgi:hypothetical protein
MKVITAFSNKPEIKDLCAELTTQLCISHPMAILYFASVQYEPVELAAEMQRSFPDAKLFGCTTAGEIVTGKMLKGSVVAMAFPSSIIEDISIQSIKNIKMGANIESAFKSFEDYYQTPIGELDLAKYVGIVLIDGLSGAEEKIMDQIGDLTDLTFIGGSAGDDLHFKETFVFVDGKAYSNAAVMALIKTTNGFSTLKTQSFIPTEHKLVATNVDEAARKVNTFNGMPAVQAYARTLGIKDEEVSKHFMASPLGLMVGDEPYVRSPQQVQGESILFYCNVKQGMELSLLRSTDMISDTRKALEETISQIGPAAGIINFNCILRTVELDSLKAADAYGDVFRDFPTIGFSTYGEEYIGHLNQTAVLLILK